MGGINKVMRMSYCYLFADRIIGKYHHIKARDHRVNLYDYHPEVHDWEHFNDSRYNLGDYLGFVVASYMLNKKGLSLETWVKKRKHLYCVGSNVFTGFQHATVWGSGLIRNPNTKEWPFLYRYPLSRYDFRAVRGPLTREWVLKYGHKCPEVYGDPAILMPFVYQPKTEIKRDLLVIPQYVSEVEFRKNHDKFDIVSMNTNDYKPVIDAIASSKLVVTNSLHAIILADAYGIPSVLFKLSSLKDGFKYYDYYYSTGRRDMILAETFEEAMAQHPLPLPDLSGLQTGLINSFPYDLWE